MDSQTVLDFWFAGSPLGDEQMARWWQKNDDVDQTIRDRFAQVVDDVHQWLGDQWSSSAEGCLAAIICLDQFPRNMYREQPESFQYDAAALRLCKQGLKLQYHQSLSVLEQSFFVMPLMHSESMTDQQESVVQFSRLVNEADESFKGYLAGSKKFAEQHRDIIARFGRYPHRNSILGRESTEGEKMFLTQPGSSF
ncbi:hypothetical protein ACH42_09695 [Endozoicomonas sp. (ex Bugula neritina AB1)]|nr:hypothetical protein ACH42_09695 [Endozoicomonas sp. (ex Bugula neritina AB1)]